MVEPASVLSVATAGFKLAFTLYSLADAIGSIDAEIKRTAIEVSLFSEVLDHLVEVLRRGQDAKCITDKALDTVQTVIGECRKIFLELEMMIEKSTKSEEVIKMEGDEVIIKPKLSVPLTGRLLYFFQKSKVELSRRQLESLKTTLSVWIGMVSIAERFEDAKKRRTKGQPEDENATFLNDKDNMKMKCLLLANETAAAEVRKHTRTKLKESTRNTNLSETRPSIASGGVMRELSKQSPQTQAESLISKPSDQTALTEVWSLAFSPAAIAKNEKEEQKIGVQETNQVVPALLALWVPNGARLNVDQPAKTTSSKDNWQPGKANVEQKEPQDNPLRREPSPYPAAAKDEDVEEEEPIDLFPRRPPRPY